MSPLPVKVESKSLIRPKAVSPSSPFPVTVSPMTRAFFPRPIPLPVLSVTLIQVPRRSAA